MATLGTNHFSRLGRSTRCDPQAYAPRPSPYHLQYSPSSSDPFPPAQFLHHLSNYTHHHNNFQRQQPSSKLFFQDHPPSEATTHNPSGTNILQKYRGHESDFMASILNAQAKEDELKAQEERGASEQERLMSKMLRLKWELQQRRWARSIPNQPATTMSEDASISGRIQPPPSDYMSFSPDCYSPSHPSPCDTQAEAVNTHDGIPRIAQEAMGPLSLPDSTQREQRESWLHSTRLPPKKLGFKRKSTHQSAVINATRVKVMKNPGKFPHPKNEQHSNQQAPLQISSASGERGPMRSRSSSPESPSSPSSPVPKLMPQNIIKPPRMSYHARLAEAKLRSSRGSPLKLVINAESLQDSCESSASPPPALTHSPLSATPSTSSSTSSSPTLSQHSHESSNPEPCSNLMMPSVMTSLPSFGSRNMLS